MTRICRDLACQHANRRGAKFCAHCGTQIKASRTPRKVVTEAFGLSLLGLFVFMAGSFVMALLGSW